MQDGQDKEKKVVIVNDDDGLRKGTCKHQPTSPNALRQDKKSFSTFALRYLMGQHSGMANRPVSRGPAQGNLRRRGCPTDARCVG